MTGADVITAARGWLNVRYRHQGRTRHGVDCIGLVLVVCRELGLTDVEFRQYPRVARDDTLQQQIARHCTRIEAPEPGCVVLFRWGQHVQHCGIYTGDTLIHAMVRLKRVREHGYRGLWTRLAHSYWRLPGVGDE